MLRLDDVTSYYGKTPILHGINIDLKKGECLCVIGRNGVGKTTLMQTVMGLTTRIDGKISIDGEEMTQRSTAERAIAGLGYVPQGRRIFGKFTVRENILLGTFARQGIKAQIPEICLELFPYLRDRLPGHRATEFRQRCIGLGIHGVTLHSYRYAWAERAKVVGYPERFAQLALGHNSKAVHRAYAKRAQVTLPPLEDYEKKTTVADIISPSFTSATG